MENYDSNKIIVHNLTLRGIEKVPGALDFDQRGILYAKDNDTVITKRPPEKEYVAYLNSLGWKLDKVTFLSPDDIDKYTYRSIFKSKNIISYLKKIKGHYIDSYQVTEEEKNFCNKIKIPLFAHSNISLKYGTKSGFRKLCKKLKLTIPLGYENVKKIDDAIKIMINLFKEGANAVVIKLDEGLSGAGNTKITTTFLTRKKKEQKIIVANALKKVPQNSSNGAIIEKWVDNAIASPSIQILVTQKGEIKILSLHDQILEGEEQWYIGCIYPPKSISKETINKIKKGALLFTNYLKNLGYFGFFGLDVVIDSNNKIWWTEANMRKPGTFYPRVIAEKLFGKLDNVNYIASDFTVHKLKGTNFITLHDVVKKYLYPMGKEKKGLVLYNTGALVDAGRFDIIVLGKNYSEVSNLFMQIKKHLIIFK